MTNYEKIKNMSVDELTDFLVENTDVICGFCEQYDLYKRPFGCKTCDYTDNKDIVKTWLKSGIEKGNIIEEQYPYIVKVGNNSEIHSKSEQDYFNLIEDIRREAIRECMQDEI
nr:MAG TPA: hypothetical protein [Caudoviricetes sp.]